MKKRLFIMLVALMLVIPVMPVSAAGLSYDNASLASEFDCIDGGTVSTQSEGKPKIIVFFTTGCSYCRYTLQSIASSEWIKNGETDVCAIEIRGASVEEVKGFRDTYCPGSAIRFGAEPSAGNTEAARVAYSYYMVENLDGGTYATPLIAMVDIDNKLQFITNGPMSGDDIGTYLPDLCPAEDPEPDDSQQPDLPSVPENPDHPGEPEENPGGNGGTGKPEEDLESQESGSSKAACSHVGEMVIVSSATPTDDAVAAYQCVKCGTVYKYETVSNSAYAAFLNETANTILNTQQEEVVIHTKLWTSFNRIVFEAMKSRPDVTVTVDYIFEGNPYVLKIPAGTDVDSLMDENGFGGFRYIEKVLSM